MWGRVNLSLARFSQVCKAHQMAPGEVNRALLRTLAASSL